MEKIKLSPSVEKQLKELHKQEKNKRRADRLKTILLLNKGFSQREISELLLIDEDSVRNYKIRFIKRDNLIDWYHDNYKGYIGKLSYVQISLIRNFLRVFLVCDKKQILNYIQSSYDVNYSQSGIYKLLERTGCSFKKLHRLQVK